MKYFLGFLSGFFLTVVVFVSGAAVTIVYLTAEPVLVRRPNTATSEPLANENVRLVDANKGSLTLVSQSGPESSGTSTPSQSISEVHENKINPEQVTSTTGATAVSPSATADELFASQDQNAYLDPEHVRACFSRYRSYRPEDNTFQPYGGGPRRQCE